MRNNFHVEQSNMAVVSLFQQTNMAAVTSCRKLLNIHKIQYGRRFFVSTNQYGGRDVMYKAIQY